MKYVLEALLEQQGHVLIIEAIDDVSSGTAPAYEAEGEEETQLM